MGRQRNRPQMKDKESFPELDEIELSNLSDREFRVMIIRILNSMKKDRNHKNGSEMKNTIPKINNTLEVINGRLNEAENQMNVLENKVEKKQSGRATKKKNEFKKMKRA